MEQAAPRTERATRPAKRATRRAETRHTPGETRHTPGGTRHTPGPERSVTLTRMTSDSRVRSHTEENGWAGPAQDQGGKRGGPANQDQYGLGKSGRTAT